MSNFQPDEAAIARMLAEQQDALTSHLTQAAAQVYDTHAGRPEDEVMQELLRRAKAPGYEPNTEGLQPAAEAISNGQMFVFVSDPGE